jgi:hypothetical protein
VTDSNEPLRHLFAKLFPPESAKQAPPTTSDSPPAHSLKHGLWSQPGVPHKGWRCVDSYDRGEDCLDTCEMCQSADVRYVHVMEHENYDGALHVGCVCAGHMSEDLTGARRRETGLKNRLKRRAKWLHRKWRQSRKGNAYLRAKGCVVTVFHQRHGFGWLVERGGLKEFSKIVYADPSEARLGAFECFDALVYNPGASS